MKSKGWKELPSLYNIESNPKTESRAEWLGRSGLKPTSLLDEAAGRLNWGWRFAQRWAFIRASLEKPKDQV